jgi:hypothetical protein
VLGPTTPTGSAQNGSAPQASLLCRLASVYTYDKGFKVVPTVAVTVRGEMLQASGAASSNRVSPRYDDSHFLRVSRTSVATNTPAVAVVEEGTYVVKTAQGEYVGQSGAISRRLQQHVASGKFTQAEVDAAERAMVTGGKLQREIAEQLLIDSKGGIDGLLNKVNPIGPKRVSVMPNQPYKR